MLSSSCVSGASSVTSCSASANSSGVSWQPPGLFNQTPTCCWFTYLKKKMLCVLCCVYYVACTMLCVLCCVYYVSYFPSVLACLWCLCAVSVCVSSSDSENEDNVPMRLTAQRQPATPAAKRPRLSSSSASKGGMLTWLLSLPLILSLSNVSLSLTHSLFPMSFSHISVTVAGEKVLGTKETSMCGCMVFEDPS